MNIQNLNNLFGAPSFVTFSTMENDKLSGKCSIEGGNKVTILVALNAEHPLSTVAHELTHVLQWINGGKKEFKPLSIPFPHPVEQWVEDGVKDRYPLHQVEVELQARGVQEVYKKDPELVTEWIKASFSRFNSAPNEYAVKCSKLMRERGFFPPNMGEFITSYGGMRNVILDFLHTPWGMLNKEDITLAGYNKLAREDLINKTIKSASSFYLKKDAEAYLQCVKYWVEHLDVLDLL